MLHYRGLEEIRALIELEVGKSLATEFEGAGSVSSASGPRFSCEAVRNPPTEVFHQALAEAFLQRYAFAGGQSGWLCSTNT